MIYETIYALRDGGVCVYVGRSATPDARARAHKSRGIKFDQVVSLATVASCDSAMVEASAIQVLRPTLNRTKHGEGFHATGAAKPTVQPVRFDAYEMSLIRSLQRATKPRMSVSQIVKRAVRFAAPKFLKGEAPAGEAPLVSVQK